MGRTAVKVGYARVSTEDQDLQAQMEGLDRLGVERHRIFYDHGKSGATRDRQGLKAALSAVAAGDTFVVTKLDRLARSVRDLSDIGRELEERGVTLSIGGSAYDPADPVGRLLFHALAMVAEFERDIIRQRTREGLQVAKKRGRLKGRQPKLSASQQKQVVRLMDEGEHTPAEIGSMFGVSRQTVYRVVAAARETAA